MKKKIIKRPPWCPFCGQRVGKATDAVERKMNEFPVGRCQCGAVYSCDVTGHNVGAAMVETLVYACGDNSELAWELYPEEDYLTGRVENYDEMTHQVIDTGNLDGRPVRGVLYFVRLHTEMAELAERLSTNKDQKNEDIQAAIVKKAISPPPPRPKKDRQRATKKNVAELADQYDVEKLAELSLDDKKTLRFLQRRLYDPMEESRWKTAWLIGEVCARVSTYDPGQVSELLHRLFEACSDSAAANWGMVETLGAVIAQRPDIFGAFTKHLLNYLGDDSTQLQVIWALTEIAGTRPDLIRDTPFFNLFHFLSHPKAEVRGYIARLLGRIKATEAAIQLMEVSGDQSSFTLWEGGVPVKTTVAQEATKAIQAIHKEK
ncbi:MAG: HEAT repeat domain-containing protein [Desulfocapsaceae bacterium]|nr:HEAT repeat domain-containing protein [Desulfocapsaceae bacterium]